MEKLKFNDYKYMFYDEFGNRINNYIIEEYEKRSDEKWYLEQTYPTYNGCYYVVNDKLYFVCNNLLISLNMDFDSKDCHACYKIIGKDTEDYNKIIGNEYLCINDYLGLKLHKQNYSDGTSFYALVDDRGDFSPSYGSYNLFDLINTLKGNIEIDKKYLDVLPSVKISIAETEKLISDIQKFI